MSHFKALYGREASELPHYSQGNSTIEVVDLELQIKEDILNILKANLARAQTKMKMEADKKRSQSTFEVGEWVLVCLQPYRQTSLANRFHFKLSQKYHG